MREHTHRLIRFLAVASALVTAAWIVAPRVSAQTSAATLYEQAQSAEQTARADIPPKLESLRKVAKTYESLVLRYPTSGYADNALWQGAGLYVTSFQQSSDASDRQQAERLLKWLKQEYPSSPFLKKIDGVLQSMAPANAAAAAPASSSAPPADGNTPPSSPPVPTTAAAATSGAVAVVKGITESALPHGERITIEFSKEVTYSGDRVDNPDRVFFDFANSTAPASLIDHAPTPSGSFIKAVRLGRHTTSVTRVVLELSGNPRYSAFPMYSPFRIVIDVEGADAVPPTPTTLAASGPAVSPAPTPAAPAPVKQGAKETSKDSTKDAPKDSPKETPKPSSKAPAVTPTPTPIPTTNVEPPPAPKTAGTTTAASTEPVSAPAPPSSNRSGDYSLSRQLGLGVSRIVIDAGHGGHDPGAQANGIDESELTLDVAQRLEKLLEAQPGFDVVLTRSSDEYIALEERTAIANREGADLFLSIHANASKQPTVTGVETYFLNFATNPTAEAVAARENASSGQTMGTLPDILKAIALNNKLAESRELATIVQTSLVRRLSMQNKAVHDLGVKQAPFVVLIGAQMPSVLAEISFLTNHSDAVLLKQSAYRQKIAQALCDGIVKYQASLKKVTTVASKDGRR
jgi:N-acetylmuramoyl-L-alanine amidase